MTGKRVGGGDPYRTGARLAALNARAQAQAHADADLLDDIRRSGPGRVWCRWCAVWLTNVPVVRHKHDCLWLRIEARGERS